MNGNAYVDGWTYSTNFPVLNPYQRTNATSYYGVYSAAFIAKYTPSGNLVYSTYFGGRVGDIARAIGVDTNGNVYFVGNDRGGGLPVTNASQSAFGGTTATIGDGFVAALDATGTNLLFSTYLGGSGDDQINGVAVRPEDGTVAVTGFTDSPNFPLLNAVEATGYQGVFRSTNSASVWNLSNAGLTNGVIYALQVDPSNPSIVYALTKSGCFKSMNGGVSWVLQNNGLFSLIAPPNISPNGMLTLDPLHPGTLYAGSFGAIYKTTNGATNWTYISLPFAYYIQSIAVDPVTPATLYVGTYNSGVYKSMDGGNTWYTATNGLSNLDISTLLIDPHNPFTLYAGADNTFSGVGAFFKSTNGGTNWTVVGSGLAPGPVTALAFNPNSSSTLFAVVSADLNEYAYLCISTNGGTNWTQSLQTAGFKFTTLNIVSGAASPALSITQLGNNDIISWPASFSGYLLQFSSSLNPASWQNVAQLNNGNNTITNPVSGEQGFFRLLQTNSAGPVLIYYLGTDAASGEGVLKSADGGNTWTATGPNGDAINALAVNPANPVTVYAGINGGRDAFVSTLTPSGQLYFSTYFGASGMDQGNAIAIMNHTNVIVVGATTSTDFPLTAHITRQTKTQISPKIIPIDSFFSESQENFFFVLISGGLF